MILKKIALLGLFLGCFSALSQGVNGVITDENGDPLPYASVFIKQKGTGTSSNVDGQYKLMLPPGQYEITFQYVGFTTQQRKVTISDDFIELNIRLMPQTETLEEVSITGSAEDPAYSIMRKAIAKAPYHLLQYDGYTAEVYIKGTGKLDKIPAMFANMAAKDGVDTSRVFTSESVSEVSFERPNTFKEKVISVRASGQELEGANPNSYVSASFYQPTVAEAVSPLSPKAMAYYRFKYVRGFEDRGYKIHEIEVIPRSRGEKVFQGKVFIRDQFWNIHSLNLQTRIQLFDITITQFYAPVTDEIWMPINQQFEYRASFFGFEGGYKYLASVMRYVVDRNEDLADTVILVDEKIEEAPEEIESINEGEVDKGMDEVFTDDKKVSRKQFRKLMRQYEKEEQKEKGEQDVISDYEYKIDSLAARGDSAYWAKVRSVPLTKKERESYKIDDSVYVEQKKDSTYKPGYETLDFGDFLLGGSKKFSDSVWLRNPGIIPRIRFNTVEGFNLDLESTLEIYKRRFGKLSITPTIRYGFASTELYAQLNAGLEYGKMEQRNTWTLSGGHYISQFHTDAINPFINSVYSLFMERNYMKLYEKDFIQLSYSRNFKYRFLVNGSLQWASRNSLTNNTELAAVRFDEWEYSSNDPVNIENGQTQFSYSKALLSKVELVWNPWLKYRKYNGVLRPVKSSSPAFMLNYNAGWNGVFNSTTDFQQLEVGLKTEFDLGVRATFDIDARAGGFLRNNGMLFTDFKHFEGGLTEIAPLSVTGNFRLLDYYLYSTNRQYVSALSHIRFRKFLFTQIPIVRLSGVKENLFINYLKTTTSPHYSEIGYGIDNIFNIFRLEFVQSFTGIEPYTFGIRVGVSSFFTNN